MEPLDQFLDNAKLFGHDIDSVVVAYADKKDDSVVKALEKRVNVHLVKICQSEFLHQKLLNLGMSEENTRRLIGHYDEPTDGRAPYGLSRNHVIIEAMLQGLDVLVFIDTDVYPEVVIKEKDLLDTTIFKHRPAGVDGLFIQTVDFFGEHKKYLAEENVMVTTSDYTGYYIIPPMKFEGMQDLFYGLKKETAYNYIMDSFHHHCLATDHGYRRTGFRTEKVLGGNVAIKLDLFKTMIPFYSSTYHVDGQKYLTRGEDTVLAIQVKNQNNQIFYDIDMKIFHNTYSDFPIIPDILNDQHIKDRFFYACMGWIGRNPFLNYLKEMDINKTYHLEHEALIKGSKAIYEHLQDDRFLQLPNAHKLAYEHLEEMIEDFEAFKLGWTDFVRRIR